MSQFGVVKRRLIGYLERLNLNDWPTDRPNDQKGH
jgi:hypothetical protein